jgi:hypothetical protein
LLDEKPSASKLLFDAFDSFGGTGDGVGDSKRNERAAKQRPVSSTATTVDHSPSPPPPPPLHSMLQSPASKASGGSDQYGAATGAATATARMVRDLRGNAGAVHQAAQQVQVHRQPRRRDDKQRANPQAGGGGGGLLRLSKGPHGYAGAWNQLVIPSPDVSLSGSGVRASRSRRRSLSVSDEKSNLSVTVSVTNQRPHSVLSTHQRGDSTHVSRASDALQQVPVQNRSHTQSPGVGNRSRGRSRHSRVSRSGDALERVPLTNRSRSQSPVPTASGQRNRHSRTSSMPGLPVRKRGGSAFSNSNPSDYTSSGGDSGAGSGVATPNIDSRRGSRPRRLDLGIPMPTERHLTVRASPVSPVSPRSGVSPLTSDIESRKRSDSVAERAAVVLQMRVSSAKAATKSGKPPMPKLSSYENKKALQSSPLSSSPGASPSTEVRRSRNALDAVPAQRRSRTQSPIQRRHSIGDTRSLHASRSLLGSAGVDVARMSRGVADVPTVRRSRTQSPTRRNHTRGSRPISRRQSMSRNRSRGRSNGRSRLHSRGGSRVGSRDRGPADHVSRSHNSLQSVPQERRSRAQSPISTQSPLSSNGRRASLSLSKDSAGHRSPVPSSLSQSSTNRRELLVLSSSHDNRSVLHLDKFTRRWLTAADKDTSSDGISPSPSNSPSPSPSPNMSRDTSLDDNGDSNGSEKEARKRRYAFREISLSLRKSELLAVVGPVGCGKSSLLLGILGELSSGR